MAAYELLFESYGNSWLEEANAGMRATAKKLMELNPDSAPAQWTTAVVKFKLDFEFAEAEKGFRRAVQIDSNNALAHVVYGWYLALMGRTSEAREELQRSADLNPSHPVAEQLLGDSYYVDRRYDKALAHYQKALALAPNFLLGHVRAGHAYEAEGDYLKAIDHFQKSVRIEPESALAQDWLRTGLYPAARAAVLAATAGERSEADQADEPGRADNVSNKFNTLRIAHSMRQRSLLNSEKQKRRYYGWLKPMKSAIVSTICCSITALRAYITGVDFRSC